jgi:hypothetical protein
MNFHASPHASPPLPASIIAAYDDVLAFLDEALAQPGLTIGELTRLAALRARIIARRSEVLLAHARAL